MATGPGGLQAALTGDDAVSFVRRAVTDGREAQASDHAALLDEWPTVTHFLQNADKNRCAETLLYDQTRVQLRGADGPYVHATRVAKPPFGSFVITQGPLANTAADFWRTVWLENVHVIVCLAQVDATDSETVVYWPPKQYKTVKVGTCRSRFTVRRLSEKMSFNVAMVREMAVKCKERGKKAELRVVYQLHYGDWPAAATGPSTGALLRVCRTMHMLQDVTGELVKDAGGEAAAAADRPILVHCSDGGGRSGTFVALNLLCRELIRTDRASVAQTALLVRQKRSGTLEQLAQYAYLYSAALEFAITRDLVDEDLAKRANEMLSSIPGAESLAHRPPARR